MQRASLHKCRGVRPNENTFGCPAPEQALSNSERIVIASRSRAVRRGFLKLAIIAGATILVASAVPEMGQKVTSSFASIARLEEDDSAQARLMQYGQLAIRIEGQPIGAGLAWPTNRVQREGGTEVALDSGLIDILVVDSVAALTPKAEIEGEMGDQLPGLQARLMSQALRKLTGSISRSNTMVIFINQIRMKIGVMFGSPETTTGGNALKFYASVRLDIRRIGSIKERDEVVGNQTRVKVVKNKLAPPFKQVEFDIMYGEGISKTGELIDLGVKAGVIEKSGAWFSYNSQRLGQGRENAKMFLRDNPELAKEVETALRQNAGLIAERFLENGGPGEDDVAEM